MGADTPLPPLSKHSQHLSNYFKQLFAQVTNPAIQTNVDALGVSQRDGRDVAEIRYFRGNEILTGYAETDR